MMMLRPFFYLLLCLPLLCATPEISKAQTAWVTDVLVLTFRQGPGNSFPVIKTLTSNTRLNVLEEKNAFLKVELPSGETGWVDKKYIVSDPPKAVLLAKVQNENAALKEEAARLQTEIQESEDRFKKLENELLEKINPMESSLKKIQDENNQLKEKLSLSQKKYDTLIEQSKNIQQIVKENTALTENNKALSTELKQIKDQSKNQYKTAMIKWFLSGVGVLLLGWIIGQSVSSKKRRAGGILLD